MKYLTLRLLICAVIFLGLQGCKPLKTVTKENKLKIILKARAITLKRFYGVNNTKLVLAFHRANKDYGISHKVFKTFMKLESGGDMLATRFEPHLYKRLRSRSLATSHCAMQVLGSTAAQYKITVSELKTEVGCVEAASRIIVNNISKCGKNNLFCIAKRYNGSGIMAERYANKFLTLYRRIKL